VVRITFLGRNKGQGGRKVTATRPGRDERYNYKEGEEPEGSISAPQLDGEKGSFKSSYNWEIRVNIGRW